MPEPVSGHQIPERKKYEMLCRGEGIKLVRKQNRKTTILTYKINISFTYLPFCKIDPPKAEPAVLSLLWQQSQPQAIAKADQTAGWMGSPVHCSLPWHHLTHRNWEDQAAGEAKSKRFLKVFVLSLCHRFAYNACIKINCSFYCWLLSIRNC